MRFASSLLPLVIASLVTGIAHAQEVAPPAPAPVTVAAPAPAANTAVITEIEVGAGSDVRVISPTLTTTQPLKLSGGVVRQIISSQNRAIIQLDGPADQAKPSVLLITFSANHQCSFDVIQVDNEFALVDTSKCAYSQNLAVGQTVERPLMNLAPAVQEVVVTESQKVEQVPAADDGYEPMQKRNPVRFSVAAYHNSANRIEMDEINGTSSSGSISGSGHFNVSQGMGLSLELTQANPHQWGFLLGLSHDFKRDLKSGEFNFAGTTYTGSCPSGCEKVSFTTMYMSAVRRWENFYLHFGLNVTAPEYEYIYEENVELTPGVGAQLGIGVYASETVSFELTSRSLGFHGKTYSSGVTTDYGYMTFSGANLGVKFSF